MLGRRIPALDIARGAAILGTLGTNIWIFASLGNFDFLIGSEIEYYISWESFAEVLFLFFMNGKFLGLLTILFGMGLEIKRRSYINNGQQRMWPWLYIWGMLLLLADGFLHYLFVFEYDVLMSYAVTGIIVAFLIGCKPKVIKGVAITLGIIHILGVLLFSALVEVLFRIDEARAEFGLMMQEMSAVYLHGTYWDQVLYRLGDFWGMRSEAIAIIPMNILLFLFGVYIIRSGLLNRSSKESRLRRKKYLKWGLVAGVPLNALMFLPLFSMGVLVRYAFAPVMALGYLMLFYYLHEKRPGLFLFNRLSEVGRTALSCYMLQNIVASILFYGWGFGLGGTLNAMEIIGVWALICIVIMLFAHVWLRKFTAGPFELIWKGLTKLPVALRENRKTA